MIRWHIQQAARRLHSGAVIAYPTEAVYGLGCNPWDGSAVDRILHLKYRSLDKGLIVIASSMKQLYPLISMPEGVLGDEIGKTWPGPVTWILPALSSTPVWLTGGRQGLAVRITAHPVARQLCELAGPLVSTSANPAGAGPARDALRVRSYFGDQLDYIVPGSVDRSSEPSQIRDAISGQTLRS